jgi:hypothetical protein
LVITMATAHLLDVQALCMSCHQRAHWVDDPSDDPTGRHHSLKR